MKGKNFVLKKFNFLQKKTGLRELFNLDNNIFVRTNGDSEYSIELMN